MLNARLGMVRIRPAVRMVHTRPKKVTVQLLKETYGKRFRGEVFDVSEGHMRLKLHPDRIAAYVLKNEAPPLPVLSTAEAQRLRKEAQLQARAEAARAEEEVKQAAGPTPQETADSKVRSLIDALDFPTSAPQTPSAPEKAPAEPQHAQQAQQAQPEGTKKKFAWQNDFVVNITDKK